MSVSGSDTQSEYYDESSEATIVGHSESSEEESENVAAPVEELPLGGGHFQFRDNIEHGGLHTSANEQVERPPQSILRSLLEEGRIEDQGPPLQQSHSNTSGLKINLDTLNAPERTDTQESIDEQLRRRPIRSSAPVGSSRFTVERVEEPLGPPSRWTSIKHFFGARILPSFRSYQCFFLIMLILIFTLAGLFSWFIHYMLSTHYIGRYFKFEIFSSILSPNTSVEQIVAVERDMGLRNE